MKVQRLTCAFEADPEDAHYTVNGLFISDLKILLVEGKLIFTEKPSTDHFPEKTWWFSGPVYPRIVVSAEVEIAPALAKKLLHAQKRLDRTRAATERANTVMQKALGDLKEALEPVEKNR